jgi:phage shock protein C
MDKIVVVKLSGHDEEFRLDADANDELDRYLDRAADRLHDDPDRADVLGDLERSIGDKLSILLGSDHRLVTGVEIERVLDEIGAVDDGETIPIPDQRDDPGPRRRLHRIREGQKIAGVCTGLAAYGEFDVAWVRTLFVLGTLLTAGLVALVYIALMFLLPIDSGRPARGAQGR